tara:strand:+ start:253 stop:387 length:135 start_codon:yes stop_codon:yes gene_type:complete
MVPKTYPLIKDEKRFNFKKNIYIYRDKKEVIKLLPYILKNKNKK